jgi:hypothetical protein
MNNGISRCGSGRGPGKSFLGGRKTVGLALALALGLSGAACAPPDGGDDLLSERQEEVTGTNGIALNGIALNGIALNGIALNGIALNGIALNGIALNGIALNGIALNGIALNGAFADWFNNADSSNIQLHSSVMKYLMSCALPAGSTASFKDKNGATHTWPGQMGLAPGWAENPITATEKQLVSGCFLGHVNSALPTPRHIQISLRGPATSLGTSSLERQALATFDGAFFGDLFSSPNKIYVCDTQWGQPLNYYNTLLADWGRQCFHDPAGCNLFKRVECSTACVKGTDGTYQSCTADGVTYKPITVFVPKMKLAKDFTLSGAATKTDCVGCVDGKYFQLAGTAKATASTLSTVAAEFLVDVRYSNATKNSAGAGVNNMMRMQVLTSTGTVTKVLENGSENLSFPYTGANVWKTRTVRVTLPANGRLVLTTSTAGSAPKVDAVSLRLP